MRSEREMMALLLGIALADERIRAVYMNGSRVNPNAPKDIYQDYDVVFVVCETTSFLADPDWVRRFGKPLILQEPDRTDISFGKDPGDFDFARSYAWLMLFSDGNRIDLTIQIPEEAARCFLSDKLTLALLDKDGLLPQAPPPSDEDYHAQRPSQAHFSACCNEFWWCLNNVAKGLARDELPYALSMLHLYVRPMLDQMVEWHIGLQTGFSLSAGKLGKYFKRYLPEALYRRYCATHPRCAPEEIWEAVLTMCDLFRDLACAVAEGLFLQYNAGEEEGLREYLYNVKNNRYESEEAP